MVLKNKKERQGMQFWKTLRKCILDESGSKK